MSNTPAQSAQDQAQCWICSSVEVQPYKARSLDRRLEPNDLRISDSNYGVTLGLRRCESCGFVFAEGDELHELFELYEKLDDPGYEESQDSRALQMSWLLDVADRHGKGVRSLLDVGAAAGLLVRQALDRGFQAVGVEPSRKLVEAARALHGVELVQGTLPHPALAGRRFDVVFLADVIEHVADPLSLLNQAAEHCAEDGVLIVVTPDVKSLARRLLGLRWWHFRLAHVGYFDVSSFDEACRRTRLKVVDRLRARWFFRVSYLAHRVARYLPVGGLVRALDGTRAARSVVPLNLFDSWVFVCRRAHDSV